MVAFSGALSRCPGNPGRSANRFDPYWDGVWSFGSSAQWLNRVEVDRRVSAGLMRLPSGLRPVREGVAEGRMFAGGSLGRKLGVLSVADLWRTATVEQVSGLLGVGVDRLGGERVLGDLWSLGLVDYGFPQGLLVGNDFLGSRFRMVRPSRSNVFERLVAPGLSGPELVSVTGGLPFMSGGQYDRHNVLATELGLRVAEFTDVSAVVGEKLSLAGSLAYDSVGLPNPFPSSLQRGDLTFVRPDGLRVVVEVTASLSAGFDKKVERWARILSRDSLNRNGLVVVFVTCPRPDVSGDELTGLVRRSVARVLRRWRGTGGSLTQDRMFVASWQELFPSSGHMVDGFSGFPVWGVSVPDRGDAVWSGVELLGASRVLSSFDPVFDAQAVVRNASMLAGSPYWLRSGEESLWEVPVRGVFPSGAPVGLFDQGRSGIRVAKVPQRLRAVGVR